MRDRRADHHYDKAVRLARAGRSDAALAAVDKVLELAPDNAAAHYLRGIQLANLRRHADAVAEFTQVAALEPGTDADYQRAFELARLERHADALAAVDDFLRIAPANFNALMLRGAELSELGRDEEALAAFGEAAECDSEAVPMAHHNRAMVLGKLGRRDEALAAHRRAMEGAQERAFFHTKYAIALAAAGELRTALGELDTACRLQPESAGEAEAWAGAILWHLGDAERSRQRFARVPDQLVSAPRSEAAELTAIARCALGDPDGARQALRDASVPRADRKFAPLYDLLSAPPLPGIEALRPTP